MHTGSKTLKMNIDLATRKLKEEINYAIEELIDLEKDNPILSVVSKANGVIVWMVRNFISKGENVVLKWI